MGIHFAVNPGQRASWVWYLEAYRREYERLANPVQNEEYSPYLVLSSDSPIGASRDGIRRRMSASGPKRMSHDCFHKE